MHRLFIPVLPALLLLLVVGVRSDSEDHEYVEGDEVMIWYNKVGPYNNPQETYTYNSLPFCKADGLESVEEHALGIGEILEGDELLESGMKALYAKNTPRTVLCSQTLDEKSTARFTLAVIQHYWYQLNVDDLPLWGIVGRMVPEINKDNDPAIEQLMKEYPVGTMVLYTHKKYSISYNGPHIIHVNITYSEESVPIKVGTNIEFTYEVEWVPTAIPFKDRFDRYLEDE